MAPTVTLNEQTLVEGLQALGRMDSDVARALEEAGNASH